MKLLRIVFFVGERPAAVMAIGSSSFRHPRSLWK
jgi:hypothetical protein